MTRFVLDIDDSQWKADHLPRVLRTTGSEWLNELACQVEIQIADGRSLVVLDLGDRIRREYVLEILRAARHGWTHDIADQIEVQTKPPRIEEPGLWGVVEASFSPTTDLDDWTRRRQGWHCPAHGFAQWDLLINPTLIREGVTS